MYRAEDRPLACPAVIEFACLSFGETFNGRIKRKNRLLTIVSALTLALCASASADTFIGSITNSDPTQDGRLFRDGVPSTCAMPKTFPGNFNPGTPYHYDAYTFTNPFGDTCLTVDLSTTFPGFQVFGVAYLGSFDPTDISINYLADSGNSAGAGAPVSYEFHVLAGQSFVVVINEVIPDRGAADYSFTLNPTTTPDSGTTAALLGVGLTGLAGLRATFGRQ